MQNSSETSTRGLPLPMDETTLAFFDRIVEPLRAELRGVDGKLDKVLAIGERVAAVEQHAPRLIKLETTADEHKIKLAKVEGRNQVLMWVMTVIGAPTVLTLIGLGLQHVFR